MFDVLYVTQIDPDTKNSRGRKQVAIAAMKGLATMKVDEVFDKMDKHLKLEGGVRKIMLILL